MSQLPSAVRAALSRAEAAAGHSVRAPNLPAKPTRFVAVGDPQAPTRTLVTILHRHGLVADDGWLRPDVHLVSMGDHFDYGSAAQRDEASRAGLLTLAWLAAHPVEQVTLIAGNHDLARVGELVSTSDARFHDALVHATRLYGRDATSPLEEAAFLRRFPEFPSVEVAARDLSSFSESQRALVTRLLSERRFRLAASRQGVLLTHAGITASELRDLRIRAEGPDEIAGALNRLFDDALARWSGSDPLFLPGIHQPGSAALGESGGALLHRPAEPLGDTRDFHGPARRRFDPRDLPVGIVQAVGHVRDGKCRALMPAWLADRASRREGRLRHLLADARAVTYGLGTSVPDARRASMLFLDGGMSHARPDDYQMLDLRTLQAFVPLSGV